MRKINSNYIDTGTTPLTALVCDDDASWRKRLECDAALWAQAHGKEIRVLTCSGREQLFQLIRQPEDIDILLLDIELREAEDGIEIAKQLRAQGFASQMIVVSSSTT